MGQVMEPFISQICMKLSNRHNLFIHKATFASCVQVVCTVIRLICRVRYIDLGTWTFTHVLELARHAGTVCIVCYAPLKSLSINSISIQL